MRPVSTPSPQPHCSKDEEPKKQSDTKESREKPKESSQPSTSFAHSSRYTEHERDYPHGHTTTHPSSSRHYHQYHHSSYSESARYRHRSKHSFRRTDRSSDRSESSARHSSIKETRKRRHEGSSQYEPARKHHPSTSYPYPSSYRRFEIEQSQRRTAQTSQLEITTKRLVTEAINCDNEDKLRDLLDIGSVNSNALIGNSNLLTLSARCGANKCITLLLSKGFDINAKDRAGYTALTTACQFGHSRLLEQLITKGANLEIKTDSGESALNVAVKRNYIGCVKILCQNIKFPVHGKYRTTGLMQAVKNQKPDLLSVLLEFDNSVDCCDDRNQTAMHMAADLGNITMLDMLLEHSPNLDKQDYKGETPLSRAVSKGYLLCAKRLLKNGANQMLQNKYGSNAVIIASRRHDLVMLELLLNHKTDLTMVDIHGKTALHNLLDPVYLPKDEKNVLSMRNLEKMTRMLLLAEPKIVDLKESGRTCLMLAAENGWLPIIKILLGFNADKYLRDDYGKNAFMNAVKHQNIECANVLLDPELIDTQDNWGKTALMFAVRNGDVTAVEWLIENKANLNLVESTYGFTALMYAVKHSSDECVKLLLEAECNTLIESKNKKTALNMANEKHVKKGILLLLQGYRHRWQ